MATTPLTDAQFQEIDDALLTGAPVSAETAAAIAQRYGIDAENYVGALEQIAGRRSHPVVGPSGRRALDALALYLNLASGS